MSEEVYETKVEIVIKPKGQNREVSINPIDNVDQSLNGLESLRTSLRPTGSIKGIQGSGR